MNGIALTILSIIETSDIFEVLERGFKSIVIVFLPLFLRISALSPSSKGINIVSAVYIPVLLAVALLFLISFRYSISSSSEPRISLYQ
jgi:hypothetical protein